MFGHDNDNDNDDQRGQITLPPTSEFDEGTAPAASNAPVTNASDSDSSAATPAPAPRKVEKSGAPTDNLLDIKQNALQALTPLLNHLDQSPEEKFRTTMMMIQAADNHSLIKEAYDAALQIGNEKERAQALLDIVNEINYFTQNDQSA